MLFGQVPSPKDRTHDRYKQSPLKEIRFLTASPLKRLKTEDNELNLRDFTSHPPTHGMGIADVTLSVGSMESTLFL
jgi:hypothetical protein